MKTTNSKKIHHMQQRSGRFHLGATAWLFACLIAAALLVWRALSGLPAPSGAANQLVAARPTLHAKPIEQIRVGDRVKAFNPELDDSERLPRTVDAANWRLVSLIAKKPDGSTIDIQLLREVDWLEDQEAAVGKEIELELDEFGADGMATVLAIAPCPPITPGTGRIVTGTFAHSSKRVIDVHIDGQKPIGCTDNHLFWSQDRFEFVPAGQLKVGEALRTANNSVTHVLAVSARGPPERVYNLEVDIDHAYFVSESGVLVHNSCSSNSHQLGKSLTAAGFVREAGEDAAHVIPAGAWTHRGQEIHDLVQAAQGVLTKHGIGINDWINGAFVKKSLHRGKGMGYHSNATIRKVTTAVIEADKRGAEAVFTELKALAEAMVSGSP